MSTLVESRIRMPATEIDAVMEEFQEFAYIVSHDLHAPLRECVSFSKLLQEKYLPSLDERGQHYLSHVLHGGSQAQAMLDGLLNYSRLNTQARPMTDEVDTAALVGQCLEALKERITAVGAVIDVGNLPSIRGDSGQLLQLFYYLLDNSLKFIRPNKVPCITIYGAQSDRVARFCVHDNGIGVAACELDEAFKPLRRLNRADAYPGVGMGLALAQKIIHRHGGLIWMESQLGQGTDLWFELNCEPPNLREAH